MRFVNSEILESTEQNLRISHVPQPPVATSNLGWGNSSSAKEGTPRQIHKSNDEEARANWWKLALQGDLDTRLHGLLENIELSWLEGFKVSEFCLSPNISNYVKRPELTTHQSVANLFSHHFPWQKPIQRLLCAWCRGLFKELPIL